ncbi:MAG: hypothetical protein Q9193_001378 [Seirophora villosa]
MAANGLGEITEQSRLGQPLPYAGNRKQISRLGSPQKRDKALRGCPALIRVYQIAQHVVRKSGEAEYGERGENQRWIVSIFGSSGRPIIALRTIGLTQIDGNKTSQEKRNKNIRHKHDGPRNVADGVGVMFIHCHGERRNDSAMEMDDGALW